MESSYSDNYKCRVCTMIVKFSNMNDKVWSGIYVCNGDKHGDMFYCGAGKCAFDRNKRVKTCEDSTCSGFGKELTLDKKKIHFKRLENELIECIICSKFIKFTEFHNHVDNCDGNNIEDEDNIKDNSENNKQEEDKNMNENNESSLIEIFKPEKLERINKYRCRICDQFAREPFYICTHSKCLENGIIYCCECYESNSYINGKLDGECVEDHKNGFGK